MTEWRPIETAPVAHGFKALVFVPGLNNWQRPSILPNMLVAAFDDNYIGGGVWVSDVADIEGYESTGDYIVHNPVHPTHWMPLPEPPAHG